MEKTFLVLIFLFSICINLSVFSQENPEDIASASDKFQISYFESLKQKAIQNYDKAIEALEKCEKIEPKNASVFFEYGKNYFLLKDYKNAYINFEKATQIDPKNRWFLVGMYDVSYATKDYNQSIINVQKLIEFKEDYKEDLVSLYMNTKQFEKALALINELDQNIGKTDKRDFYKSQILQDSKFQTPQKDNLLEQIKKNPKEESNYLELIRIYSQSGQELKAEETAKKLEKEIPTSDWAQVSLFKIHINKKDGDNAVKAMNVVYASNKIDNKIKHRILNEFLIFVKTNPKYNLDLEKAIDYFKNDSNIKVAKEVAKYYHKQKDYNNAIKYYEQHFQINPTDDVESTIMLFECYLQIGNFEILSKKAEKMIDSFPSQPQFYYFAGISYNQLKNYKKAKDYLESGMDYLVDDKSLEINFNIQLGECFSGLGDNTKKEMYFTKAQKLLTKKQ